MQDKIKTIREKCIEVNPSILDLVFGCRLIWNKPQNGKAHRNLIVKVRETHPSLYCVDTIENDSWLIFREYPKEECTIIGRDVRLADILHTIRKTDLHVTTEGEFGRLEDQYPDTIFLGYDKYWDLKNDSLDLQGEDTINYLYNLLQ